MVLRTLFRLALGARPPTWDGRIELEGLDAPLTLRRDEHGVAYVDAKTDADAFFGLGFCQAQDRAFQIELLVRIARGTLCELVGPEMLDVDKLSRRLGFAATAARQLACADEGTRAQFTAFARGVNAGLSRGAKKKCHELTLLGAEPSTFLASDSLAVLQFLSFALSSNWDAELARLRVLREDGPEALLALEPSLEEWRADIRAADRLLADIDALHAAEQLVASVAALGAAGALGGASNAWAIAPSRSATGRPILAGDPHLSPTLPAPWYLVHVRTPTWAMTGACFVTQPIASVGHNEHGAWGITIGHVDNTDLFVERIGPDGRSVLEGERYLPCEVREETIRVKGKPDVAISVLVTPRGPIVSPALGESRDALSLRGTWMAIRPMWCYSIFRTRDVDAMRACFASYPAETEGRIFADTKGQIAWQLVGDAPVRKRGHGLLPAPGWLAEYGWEDEPRPFQELPFQCNPERGFVATANQRPPVQDPEIFLGADWLDGYRCDRIVERLAERSDWTVAECLRLQLDRGSLLWRELRETIVSAGRSPGGADLAVAMSLLDVWDGDVAPTSAAASVFEIAFADLACRIARARAPKAWRAALGERLNEVLTHGTMPLRRVSHVSRLLRDQPLGFFDGGWPAEIRDALGSAVKLLRERHGARVEGWAWGKVRPLRLRHPVAAKAPFDRIFSLPEVAVGGDVTTIPQASIDFHDPTGDPIGIANLRVVIDVGAWENSRWSLAGGQSGNPCSRHFGDLLPVWERGEAIAIAWSPEEVARRARATLRLTPR